MILLSYDTLEPVCKEPETGETTRLLGEEQKKGEKEKQPEWREVGRV